MKSVRIATSRLISALVMGAFLALGSVAQAQPASDAERPPLTDYEGSFEGREFLVENGDLTYFRAGMMDSITLAVIGEDHFDIVIPPGAVVQTQGNHEIPTFQFNRDEDGNVVSLSILAPGGELMSEHPRTGDVEPVEKASPVN